MRGIASMRQFEQRTRRAGDLLAVSSRSATTNSSAAAAAAHEKPDAAKHRHHFGKRRRVHAFDGRTAREPLSRLADRGLIDRADVALRLCQDQVGLQVGQQIFVKLVQAPRLGADKGVNLSAGRRRLEFGCASGEAAYPRPVDSRIRE